MYDPDIKAHAPYYHSTMSVKESENIENEYMFQQWFALVQDDPQLLEDSEEVPKIELNGCWFDFKLWNLLST